MFNYKSAIQWFLAVKGIGWCVVPAILTVVHWYTLRFWNYPITSPTTAWTIVLAVFGLGAVAGLVHVLDVNGWLDNGFLAEFFATVEEEEEER